MIFDAHLDLAMNALDWNRDLSASLEEINKREANKTDKPDRGNAVVSFEEMRNGDIGLCVATLIARYVKPSSKLPGWHSPEQAWAHTQGQWAWYKAMELNGELNAVKDFNSLEAHLEYWNTSKVDNKKIGYILSLEGADSIHNLDYLYEAHERGLRAIGPAHYGPGTYAFGTDSDGPLSTKGKELLNIMDGLGFILDITHLSDTCFWEALDIFGGSVWASHHLCRYLVPHNRQLDDNQIKAVIARGGVIGMAFDAWMIVPGWQRGISTPLAMGVNMNKIIDHLDHICQLAGNTNHVGIGSDLDGGFGTEQCPYDIESIADVSKMSDLLRKRGYSETDVSKITSLNWISFLRKHWS